MKQASFEILAERPGHLETEASLLGDNVMWVKFIFTDDGPNANKQAVPKDEFASIVKTGKFKPFKKMTGGIIGINHDGAVPIGTIVGLEEIENRIEAIAAVWEKEYPDDATQLREAKANDQPLHVSWELLYGREEVDQAGVSWLRDIITRAATVVSMPAYEGRTPILAVAAKSISTTQKDEGESSMELEQLKAQLEVKEQKVEELEGKLEVADASLEELKDQLKELESLRTFKQEVEAQRERADRLNARFKQIAEAGVEMKREEFEAEADRWLGMDDNAFSF